MGWEEGKTPPTVKLVQVGPRMPSAIESAENSSVGNPKGRPLLSVFQIFASPTGVCRHPTGTANYFQGSWRSLMLRL